MASNLTDKEAVIQECEKYGYYARQVMLDDNIEYIVIQKPAGHSKGLEFSEERLINVR